MSWKKKEGWKIIKMNQDGNREWILLLATICVMERNVLSVFICQKEFEDLKDIRIKNINNNTFYFAVILIGLSNNNIERKYWQKDYLTDK